MNIVKKKDSEQFIRKEDILSKIDDWSIFRYYIGKDFEVGRAICSIFRRDKNPSMTVHLSGDGKLRYTDFGDDKYNGDAFDMVSQLYNISLDKAIHKIAIDFQLTTGSEDYKKVIKEYHKPIITEKKQTFIQVTTKKFTSADISYWDQYGINIDDLRKEEVYSVKTLFVNRKKRYIGKDELCFAYHYDGHFKIYFPCRSREAGRWISNIPLATPIHLENLNKDHNSLVTKSLKDYIVCHKIYPYTCAIQNESLGACPDEIGKYITNNSKAVLYAGDCDRAGKSASYRITEKYGWKHINPPDRLLPLGAKDWSDWYKLEGEQPIIEHFKTKGLWHNSEK